ncbi:hypothetical protein C8F04DRAFT_943601 [Mycena alexandri]|uniref:Translation machinery-associated protein 16 n=1 Tax=Mycena alexandri TaxID=1745969 RepID=A0AAD6TDW4_9AGAR|nr:hypothetical protein C8F04DRAFT_943601 [Mycena alexandri]
MPPKAKAAVKGGKPAKKEKVFHPDSRKAGQLARNALRKGKLGNLRTKRTKKASSMLELYAFFHAALPPDVEALTLPELHTIAEAWVARNDAALAEEQAARRKGRPKSAREVRIEELKLREQETYRTGMELPDLTDASTLGRFRKWDVASIGYAHLLRFVRISSALPDVIVFSRAPTAGAEPADEDEGEEEDDAPQLLDEMDET